VTNPVTRLGAATLEVLRVLGHHATLFAALVRACGAAFRRPHLIVAQVHALGNLSVLIVVASGMAVGFVLALQLYYTLVRYGATDSLGLIVNLSLTRELGPVLAALLFAGRAGTSLTAEIGLMKAGEQLAALDMMALDPVERILAPRFIGGIIAMPILAILFSTVGILAAYVLAVLLIGVDAGNFWSIMHSGVDAWRDVGNGLVKSVVFGLICTFVALYQGYEAEPTPKGVSEATTRGVVVASLATLIMDFVLTAMMFSTPGG